MATIANCFPLYSENGFDREIISECPDLALEFTSNLIELKAILKTNRLDVDNSDIAELVSSLGTARECLEWLGYE